MAWKIADLFVQFALQGVEAVVKGLDQVKAGMESVQKGAQIVGNVATVAFAGISASMYGFVRSGLAASNMGTLLSFQFERLSRSIAGLFQPEIRKVIESISALTAWIERLTPQQKEMIARFLMGAAAATAVATAMPFLLSGIMGVVGGIRALVVAVGALEGETGVGALLPLLGAAVAAFAAFAVGTEVGRNGLSGFWAGVKPVLEGLGSLFEQLSGAFAPLLETLSAGLQEVVQIAGQMFGAVVRALGPVVEAIGHVVRAFYSLRPALGGLGDAWSELVNSLRPLIELAGQLAASFIDDLVPVLQATVLPLLRGLIGVVTGVFQAMRTWYTEAILPLWSGVADLAAALHSALAAAVLAVLDAFQAAWAALEPFRDLVFALGEVFLYFAKTVLQVVIEQLQKLALTLHVVAAIVRALVGSRLDFNLPKFEAGKPGFREQLPLRTGGFENIEQTYKRIAEASIKVGGGKTIEEKQLEKQEEIRRKLLDVEEAVKGNRVPIR